MDLVSLTRETSESWWDQPSLQQMDEGLVKKGHRDIVCSPLLWEVSQRKQENGLKFEGEVGLRGCFSVMAGLE